MINWAPGAYFCSLIRYWHFETIFALALQQNPSAGWNFTQTLIWPNDTLFRKKKLNLRCGVAVAAKMARNGLKMAQNGQKIKCLILTLIIFGKPPRVILTPFLTISVMNWAHGAYICPLMRYWHFETIFGLELQQNPSVGQNFTHTLIWPNLTLFWKKKLNSSCGVAVAAKMAKNGRKMAQNGQTIKCIILA